MKNLKILSILIVLVLAASLLTACADPIQDDLKSYVNDQIPAVQALVDKGFNAYNEVAGDNYKDDATMLAALNDTVVPASNEALEAAKKIAPATKEVAAIHEQLITALTTYNTAYTTLVDALTNGDAAKVDESATLLTNAQTQDADFLTALTALAKDHGLKINTK